MKFNKLGRNTLLATLSLALAGTFACSRDYTAAYVYATSSSGGGISAYGVDFQTGILNQISGSPFTLGVLTNPSTLIPTPNGKTLFVIGGSQQAQIQSLAIGTDGKLYGQQTYDMTGTYPTSAAVDSTGSFLYVTYTYQIGFGPQSKGPGGVSIFKINADGSLGTPINQNVGNSPVGIALTVPITTTTPANQVFAYVIDQEVAPNATVLQYSVDTTSGALTLIPGTFCPTTFPSLCGLRAGVTPSAITVEPTARFVYVTDSTSNQVIGYTVLSSGSLQALSSSPFPTGTFPVALTVDPRGKYLYTANFNANSVTAFTINHADGSLGGAASGSFTTATGPNCLTIEPSVGIYLYTSNNLDNSISGAQLSPNTGELQAVANTPFPSGVLPSCVASVANGSHANSLVSPN